MSLWSLVHPSPSHLRGHTETLIFPFVGLKTAAAPPLIFSRPWFFFLFLLKAVPTQAVGWPLPTVQVALRSTVPLQLGA